MVPRFGIMGLMRLTAEPLIARAAESDQIMELSVRRAMAHFSLRADEVRAAKDRAMATWPRARLIAVNKRVKAARVRRRCLSHAVAHPGIHRRLIIDAQTCRQVAEQYQINHAMAHIVRTDVKELADILGEPIEKIVESIEAEARRPDAAEHTNKPRGDYVHSPRFKKAQRAAAAVLRSKTR